MVDANFRIERASQRALDAVTLLIVILDGSRAVAHTNTWFTQLTGHDASSLSNRDWIEALFPERERTAWADRIDRVYTGRSCGPHIGPVLSKGQEVAVDWAVTPHRGGNGELQSVTIAGRAVTSQTEAQVRYRTIVHSLQDGVIIYSPSGEAVEWNASAERILGRRVNEARGSVGDSGAAGYYAPNGEPCKVESLPVSVTLRTGNPVSATLVGVDVSPDDRRWLLSKASPYRSADGTRLLGVVRTITDVTDRQRDDERVRASEARLADSQQLAKVGSWSRDFVTGALDWSEEAYRIFEVDRATFDASYEAFLNLVHPNDREELAKAYVHSVEHGTQYEFVHRILTRDGRMKWLHERGRTVYSDVGRPLRTIGTVQDITERKRLEDRLQHAQRLAKTGAWEIGPLGSLCWWSDETFRILGADPESTLPSWETYLSAAHPDDRDQVDQASRVALKGRAPFVIAHRLLVPSGEVKHVLIQGHPTCEGAGPSTLWEGTIQDTTEQVRAERRMRDVLDGIVAFVGVFSLDGVVTDINRAPLEAAGLRRHEVVGKRFCEAYWWCYDPEVTNEVRAIVGRAAQGETVRTDLNARLSADRFAVVDAVFAPLRGAGGEVEAVIASAVDVTERAKALAAWKESDERLRLVIAASGQGIWTMELDPIVARFSPEHARLLGYAPNELVSRDRGELLKSIHPDDVERVPAAFRAHLAGETELYRAEFRSRTASGAWKWLLAVGRVVERAPDARPMRLVGTHTDIDERVQAERRIAASLREKEMLLREIHHRVKNNLQVIASLIHFQSKRIPGAEAAATFADLRQRIYAMTLVHERLYQSSDVARVDLREYVVSLVNELTRSFEPRPGIRIEVEAEQVLLPIENALPCGMLLCELVTNVLKYAFPGRTAGRGRVQIGRRGHEIILTVSDDGVGLPVSVTPVSGGGFGWELVRMLALQLAAEVSVENADGACVRVAFAAADPEGCYA